MEVMQTQNEQEADNDREGSGEVLFQRDRAVLQILLNRPDALNALNDAITSAISAAIPNLARDPELYAVIISSTRPNAFCIGTDLAALMQSAQNNIDDARTWLAQEYAFEWLLDCFSKPTIAMIEGAVMGAGAGLTHFCTHRVAAETYKFATPQTAFGFFPDAGMARVLAGLPHYTGFYLALTGRTIGRSDAYALGLATHCIAAAQFNEIVNELADAQPIDPLLDDRHRDPGTGTLAAHYDCISETFSAPDIEELILRLENIRADYHAPEWIDNVIIDLKRRSPTALAVTQRHLQRAHRLDLRENLIADYALAAHFLHCKDFYEGVRSMLVDRDEQPQWVPSAQSQVSHDTIEHFLSVTDENRLELASRDKMQAARV